MPGIEMTEWRSESRRRFRLQSEVLSGGSFLYLLSSLYGANCAKCFLARYS